MRYAICDKQKAIIKGYQPDVHRQQGNTVLLNEKEVMQHPAMTGTFEERISTMNGRMLTDKEMQETIRKGDWK